MKSLLLIFVFLMACDKSEQVPYFSPEPAAESAKQDTPTSATPSESDAGGGVSDVGNETGDVGGGEKAEVTGRARALEGTPHDHIEGQLVLKYEGPTGEFDLYRAVGDRQSVGGKGRLESGMVINISRSTVLVSQPRILTAKHDLDVIATRWDRAASRSGKEDLHPIKKGEQVKLLKAEKGGLCWMAIVVDEFVAGCPITDDFEGEGWNGELTPIVSEWWVKTAVGGARGWLPIDEVSFSWEFVTKKKR